MSFFVRRQEKKWKDPTREHVLGILNRGRFPSWSQWRHLPRLFTSKERAVAQGAFATAFLSLVALGFWLFTTHHIRVPAVGGTYVEAVVGEPQFINPLYASQSDADQDLTRLVYSGLYRWDPSDGLVPDLAERVEISEDQKTYTVFLRTDATWHTGTPVVAHDVVFTLQSIQDPLYRSPLAAGFAGVEVSEIDDHTVQFVLKEAFAPFLATLTVGILPADVWQPIPPKNASLAPLNREPVGSGPYRVDTFSVDKNGSVRSYTLVRNEAFYRSAPPLETLIFRYYTSPEEAADALTKGQTDGLGYVPADLVATLKKNRGLSILEIPSARSTVLLFNTSRSTLSTTSLRRALALAINKEVVAQAALESTSLSTPPQILQGPIPPQELGYHPDLAVLAQNIEEANRLLDATVWKRIEGDAIRQAAASGAEAARPFALALATVDHPEFIRTAEVLRDQLLVIGLRVDITVLPPERLYDEVVKPRAYDMLLMGTQLGIDPDPYSFWHSSQLQHPGLNLTQYSNRQVDTLLEEARHTNDASVRTEKYHAFQEALAEDIPAVFLYQSTYRYAIPKRLNGVSIPKIFVPADRFADVNEWYLKIQRKLTW